MCCMSDARAHLRSPRAALPPPPPCAPTRSRSREEQAKLRTAAVRRGSHRAVQSAAVALTTPTVGCTSLLARRLCTRRTVHCAPMQRRSINKREARRAARGCTHSVRRARASKGSVAKGPTAHAPRRAQGRASRRSCAIKRGVGNRRACACFALDDTRSEPGTLGLLFECSAGRCTCNATPTKGTQACGPARRTSTARAARERARAKLWMRQRRVACVVARRTRAARARAGPPRGSAGRSRT